jgi:ZIP family zinc transporter
MNPILFGFIVTLFAGLSTGIGSAIAFFARRTNYRFLAAALGFSGGVMVYVSFVEIFRKAEIALNDVYGSPGGAWATVAGFFGGMVLMGVIDWLIPGEENPHEPRTSGELGAVRDAGAANDATTSPAPAALDAPLSKAKGKTTPNTARLVRMGLFTALAIAIHNFPEGLATFLAAVQDPSLGIAIAVAIAIHNIPEGISVSVPIYFATGNRGRAFFLSLLSGLSEVGGAFLGWLLLSSFGGEALMGIVFAGVAGVMVYISLDELLPTAREYGENHQVLLGLLSGMAVMAVSLLLFKK